jgi:hypothetical protein
MKNVIEGINKEHRSYFKQQVKNISDRYKIVFKGSKAYLQYEKDYIITDNSLIKMSQDKKALNTFIHDFRIYQFNN